MTTGIGEAVEKAVDELTRNDHGGLDGKKVSGKVVTISVNDVSVVIVIAKGAFAETLKNAMATKQ